MTSVFIHETAIVDQPSEIGTGTKIWHFCHVMGGARIGEGCVLGQNVFVGAGAVIGNRVKVQNNVSIYDGVELEDEVFVGPSAVFTNVATPRAHVSRKGTYENTLVCRRATIGANATVICGVIVGEYAFLAAGAVVTSDVERHALMLGAPARQAGWMCRCGAKLPSDTLECEDCGDRYTVGDQGLEHVVD